MAQAPLRFVTQREPGDKEEIFTRVIDPKFLFIAVFQMFRLAFDVFFDDRGDISTTRSAWAEVRDNNERGSCAYTLFDPFSHFPRQRPRGDKCS